MSKEQITSVLDNIERHVDTILDESDLFIRDSPLQSTRTAWFDIGKNKKIKRLCF